MKKLIFDHHNYIHYVSSHAYSRTTHYIHTTPPHQVNYNVLYEFTKWRYILRWNTTEVCIS